MFLIGFPLLLVPFAIYNIIAFLMPGVNWAGALATIHMMSDADWTMTGGDILIAISILLLFVEMMKVARIGKRNLVDHGLAVLVFLAMLAEFLLVKQAASAIFFLLLTMSFFDVLGGFTLSLRSARRHGMIESREPVPESVAPPVAERIEPVPPSAEHIPS